MGEDTQGRGKWAALTFLVLPRALGEEQLVLSIWEVGWKKLIHEGAGRKDKAGWQTEPPWATVTDASPQASIYKLLSPNSLTAALRGRCYCAHCTDVETEALRGQVTAQVT